ncbi:MAG: hypothetical protein ACD_16C00072G0001 [uncultured bacterium]|nr:MAG: hypothetical protein ACD_16C00072G0001 [uncultured bacterium]
MAKPNITASSEFLNEFEWQLQRLFLLIGVLEGLTASTRNLHHVFSILLKDAQNNR